MDYTGHFFTVQIEFMETWQQQLSNVISSIEQLASMLDIQLKDISYMQNASDAFKLRVPHSFVSRMKKANINDPLLLQVLPQGSELISTPGYFSDPLEEKDFNPVRGLLHKYPGRVLVTLSGSCAIHCRYCFRRHFPYQDNNRGRHGWENIFFYIQNDKTIEEVILSGGDPLIVPDNMLKGFIRKLETINHIKRLRIHTRLPIVIPPRITDEFVENLNNTPLQTIMVLHCNHAQEINDEVQLYLNKLRSKGIPLLNQSVLLKGVNDSVEALSNLSKTLFSAGVMPYYLHVLDKVQGAQDFDLPLKTAQSLIKALRESISGYLVPKLVVEIPGEQSKTPKSNS